jgi:geranylgeranyl pyrophosphate synthase
MSRKESDAMNIFSHVFGNFVASAWDDHESSLHKAIRYCLEGDGKRVRASLALMVCQSYGQDPRKALSAGAAVEMVHAYSLAHDDLPCMDNDDFRRGRPSLHKAFDEVTALLAGDAILTDAMRVISDVEFFPDGAFVSDTDKIRMIRELSLAAGGHGMVYGQNLDMFWTGRGQCDKSTLDKIHKHKTGALIGGACAMGAVAAGAPADHVPRWRQFGILIGLAFQAVDDTLDIKETTGKTKGKDKEQGKLTYLSLHSCEEVQRMVHAYTEEAVGHIPPGLDSGEIVSFVRDLIARKK